MNPNYLWLAAVIILVVVEAATVGLVSLWFAVGALAAFVVSFFTPSPWIQLGVFALVSVAAMALIRPLAKKYLIPKKTATNADRILGQEALVLEEIDNLSARGRVSVAGMEWAARSEDGAPIPAGALVTILRIEGVKVFVSPAKAGEKEV